MLLEVYIYIYEPGGMANDNTVCCCLKIDVILIVVIVVHR